MLFCCSSSEIALGPFLNPRRAPRSRARTAPEGGARQQPRQLASSKRDARTVAAHVPATHGVAAAGSRAEHALSVAAPGERGPHQRHDDVDAGRVGQVRQLLANHRGRGRLRHSGRREGRARRCGRRKARATPLGGIDHGLRRCGGMCQSAVWPVPQLGSCASSGCAWRLWAARYAQEEAGPLGAQPLPRAFRLAASKSHWSFRCL